MKKLFFMMLVIVNTVTAQQIDSVEYQILEQDNQLYVEVVLSWNVQVPRKIGFQVARESSFQTLLYQDDFMLPLGGLYATNIGFGLNQLDTLPETGTYYARVFLEDTSNGVAIFSDTFEFNGLGTSVTVIDAIENAVSLYPNPTANTLSVSGINETHTVSLYDLAGKQVFHGMRPAGDSEPMRFDLPNGMYLYHLQTESGSTKNGKLVVQ